MRFISAKSSYKSKCSAKVPPDVPLNRHHRTQCRSRAYCIDTEPSEGWCLSGVVIRTAPLVSGFSECPPSLRPCTISPRGRMFFFLWWRSFESISGTGVRLADRMACTNVSSTEFTLSAVTSGAWVMRTISFSLLIQSSLLMFARKLSFSRSSHKTMCYTVKYRSIIIIPDPR